MPEVEPLLTEKQVAAILQTAVQTLRNWRCRGVGPAFTKVGPLVRYTPQALRDYSEARTRRTKAA
jgi:hypothetical protein